MPVPSREEVRAGIFYMLASVFVFSMINALVKWEAARYPLEEVVFFRCAFSLFPALGLVFAGGGARLLRTGRLGEHVGRGVLQFISMMCIFAAFGLMPLADAVAITFSAPLFLTILSIPLLGERVGRHRWAAVLVGFGGVLLMVRSGGGFGGGLASTGALMALASAAIGANVTIAVRRMTLTEASPTLVAYQALVTTALSAILLPYAWTAPALTDALLMAATGLCSGIGQFWWTQAFRFAPAAVAAPFSYLSMIWSLGLGYLIWGDVPGWALLGGGGVVAASGLYILYRETVRCVPQAASARSTDRPEL
ncbi:MAG TPA: DMT family transporter [Stellaceae bacterium]|nr:DMT family transporter [Stellaceae bacterium]